MFGRLRKNTRSVALSGICRALAFSLMAGCGSVLVRPAAITPETKPEPAVQPVQLRPATTAVSLSPWLLHLPGIGGKRSIDLAMTTGFQQGGFTGDVEIYDWTENDIGLDALVGIVRNKKEARLIADKITERFDKDPASPIYLSCHSGGGGLAIWALEDLPDRVKINTLLMMSPALSPMYDLSKALAHITGKAYVFSSLGDQLVLGTGCRLFGTIDGIKTDAAGRIGFTQPPTADAGQYAKLVPMPYQPAWLEIGDRGDHVGGMNHRFARLILAPLVLSGTLPAAPTSEPVP